MQAKDKEDEKVKSDVPYFDRELQKKETFGEREVGYFDTGYGDLDATRRKFACALDAVDELRGKAEAENNLDKIAGYDQAIEHLIKANYLVSNAVINNFD